MDVLKDRQYRTYDYVSRYASFPTFYNTMDGKYVYGITNQLDTNVAYTEVKVIQGDTLESLSEEYYGRPDYYWIIADFNRITDPFRELFGWKETLRLPNVGSISFLRD